MPEPAHDMAIAVAPAAPGRIDTLDILRGFALFGMILVHFHQKFRESTALESFFGEKYVGWVVWLGVEQKSWATFAFLFGVGFAILLRSAESKGQPLVPLYLRRMAGLAAIGVAILVFTGFRILLDYAVWGVPLLFLRNRSTRTLLVVAVVAVAATALVALGTGLYELLTVGRAGADAAWQARLNATPAATAALSYGEVVQQRLQGLPQHLAGLLLPGSSFTLFVVGLLAVRSGIFDEPRRHLSLILSAMAVGLASWLAYWLLLPRVPMDFASMRVVLPLRYGMNVINEQWLAFTYIGALVLLLAYRPRWTARLASFGVTGRMALTNYVMQCIVFEYLSSPFGLNLKLRPYYYVLGAFILFGVQIVLSRLWLARFRFGPLEWLWRSLTYLRWQPIRTVPREPATLVAAGN